MWSPTRPLTALLLLLLISGCGFHLRGAVILPPQLERTLLQGIGSGHPLAVEIERALRSGGGRLVGDSGGATAILRIAGVKESRRVISVDSGGKAQEYGLTLAFSFSLQGDGGTLVGVQPITIERSLLYDRNNVLGSAGEESTLRDEMRRYAVAQMIRRINAALR